MTNSHTLTTEQAAENGHVSQGTIISGIDDGPLESHTTTGSHHPILRSDLFAYLEHHGMPVRDGRRVRHRGVV